jgi:hypothetical protein
LTVRTRPSQQRCQNGGGHSAKQQAEEHEPHRTVSGTRQVQTIMKPSRVSSSTAVSASSTFDGSVSVTPNIAATATATATPIPPITIVRISPPVMRRQGLMSTRATGPEVPRAGAPAILRIRVWSASALVGTVARAVATAQSRR